jgi:DNA-binding transcriptional ArsR family regulator
MQTGIVTVLRMLDHGPPARQREKWYFIILMRLEPPAHFVKTASVNLIAKQEHIETAARALKAISHPLRLKILCVIGDEEVCVQEIVEAVGTSQSNISQHLAILRDKDVLLTRKDANRVYYRVGDPRTLQLIAMMREVFCAEDAE